MSKGVAVIGTQDTVTIVLDKHAAQSLFTLLNITLVRGDIQVNSIMDTYAEVEPLLVLAEELRTKR